MPSGTGGRTLFFGALLVATLAPFALILGLAPHEAQLPGLGLLMALTGGGHVGSTLAVFGDREFRPLVRANMGRFIALPLALGLALAFSNQWRSVQIAGSFAVLCWQLHHYQRQSYGIVAFVSKAANIRPLDGLNAVLNLTVFAGVLGIVASKTMFGDGLADVAASQLRVLAILLYAVALVWLAVLIAGNAELRGTPVVMATVLAAGLFFAPALLPGSVLVVFWTYAAAHGAQYLIFMTALAWNSPERSWASLRLGGAVTIGAGLAWIATTFWPSLGPVYGGLLCGHFLIDAKIWKLRQMPQRAVIGRRFGFVLAPPQFARVTAAE